MLGQEDIFSRAALENQMKNIGDQFEKVLKSGIPEEGRAFLGMAGFRVKIRSAWDDRSRGGITPDLV
jgi:hypothetical protein